MRRIEGGAGGDEERLVVGTAKGQAGRALGHPDHLDRFAGGAEDADPSGGDVDVALPIRRERLAALLNE